MAGGRISGHPIRESAQPPVSVGASASTRAAASPPAAAGRQAARPAELGGLPDRRHLARRPARRTACRGMPPCRCMLQRGRRRQTRWMCSTVRCDISASGALWPGTSGSGKRWGRSTKLSPDREVAYARSAIESIRKGLQALATLKRQRRLSPGYDTDAKEGELLQLLASAADIGVCTRTVTLNQIANQEDVFEAERSDTVEAGAGPDSACADPTEAPEPAGGGRLHPHQRKRHPAR